jgi:hypothetical protein
MDFWNDTIKFVMTKLKWKMCTQKIYHSNVKIKIEK